MNKTMLVMVQEIRTTLKRKTFLAFGFGIPIVLGIVAVIMMVVNRDATPVELAISGLSNIGGTERSIEGLVDEGGLIEFLPANVPQGWLLEYSDEAAAQSALEAEKIEAYYVVAADYAESGQISYVKPTYNPIEGGVNSELIEWIILANLLGDERFAAQVREPLDLEVTSLAPAEESSAESWIAELLPNAMALILYLVILMSSSVLVAALTDEKKNRVLEVLLSSVSSQQLVTGKIIAVGILGLLILLLWIGVLWSVANFGGQPLAIPDDFNLPTSLLVWACIYGLLGYAMYGAQMAGLGALAPDIKDSKSVSFLVMIPLIAVYVFLLVIITNPDGPIAIALSLFPLTSPVAMITRMTATDVPLWQSALAAVLQLIGAILIVRFVARLFRAQNLLSGQPLSMKRYIGALFGRS